MPEVSGVHHVAFTVTDLKRSGEWYERVLGATKLIDEMELFEGHRLMLYAFGGLIIGLHNDDRVGADDRFTEFRVGLDHIGFGCADRAELEAWEQRLSELGVEHSPITDAPYGHVLVFRDPDNIQLEFIAMP